MVEGKGQLCSLEADVSNRKRNSSGDVLLEGVLHNQSNTSTAVLHAPVELINFSPDCTVFELVLFSHRVRMVICKETEQQREKHLPGHILV